MSSDRDTLLSMGFDPTRVEWALKATSNRGLQPAMDHILENDGKPVPNLTDLASSGASSSPVAVDEDDEDAEALKAVYGAAGAAGAAADVEAKSIKCSECGKVFKNTALANYHAEKSGHDQFEESTEEIKPLTEEEKKQKLEELREKMAAKRAQKAQQDAVENKVNDAIRRKAGKDMAAIKEEMKAKEAIKEAEQRRRDKIADAKAKAAVKAQIEADKRERAEKAAREKALRQGLQPPQQVQASTPAAAATPSAGTSSKDHKETRLQIRMSSGGQPFTTTLPSESTLRDVAEFVAGQTLSVDVDTVSFAQHFPRKLFSQADFSKTLKELGLTPSAVLIAS
ncbi:ubiquitin-related domain-containing protein [Hysterangium stoloniferum]|nr:ubiquitin-related domain-containing protein [Hysterangium stoloniferum]